ncbi:MAG: hypothetical protein AB2561_01325, partial [Candidatus Thiodiazotropha endolucinida]
MDRDERKSNSLPLNQGTPTRDDPIEEGPAHIRRLKQALNRRFAGFAGTVLLQGRVVRKGADLGTYPVEIAGSPLFTAGSLVLFQADEVNAANARVYLNQQLMIRWVDAAAEALAAGRVRAGEWTLSVYDGESLRLLSQGDVARATAAIERRLDEVEAQVEDSAATLTEQVEALGGEVREAKAQAKGLKDRVLEAIRKEFRAGLSGATTRLDGVEHKTAEASTRLDGLEHKTAEASAVAQAAKEQSQSAVDQVGELATQVKDNQSAIEQNRSSLEANALPAQSGQAGHYLMTDGAQAAWQALPASSSVDEGALKEAVKADLKASFSPELRAAEEKLNAVESRQNEVEAQAKAASEQAESADKKAQSALTKADSNRAAIEAHGLPEQRGQAGHYLSTDGQVAKWEELPDPSGAVAHEAKAQADEARERVQSVADKATNLEKKVADNQTAIEQNREALERQQSAIEQNQDVLGDQQATLDRHNQAIEGNALPAQSGQAGHYLSTDGERAVWVVPAVDGDDLEEVTDVARSAVDQVGALATQVKDNQVALKKNREALEENRGLIGALDEKLVEQTVSLGDVQGQLSRVSGLTGEIPGRWNHYQLLRAAGASDADFRWRVPSGVYHVGVACWGAGGKQGYAVGYAGAGGAGFAFGVFSVAPGQVLEGLRVGLDANDGITSFGEHLFAYPGGNATYQDFKSMPGRGGEGVVKGSIEGALTARGGRGGGVIQRYPGDDEGYDDRPVDPARYGEVMMAVGGGGGGAGSFYGDGGAGGEGVSGGYVGSGGGGGGFCGTGGLGRVSSACGAGGGGACEGVLGGDLARGGSAGQRGMFFDNPEDSAVRFHPRRSEATGAHWQQPWGLGGGGGGGSGSAGQSGRLSGWSSAFSTGGHGGSGLNGLGGAGALTLEQSAGRGRGYGDDFLDLAHRCLGGGGGGGANVFHACGGDGGPGGGGGGACVTLSTHGYARAGMGGLGGGGGGAGVCPVHIFSPAYPPEGSDPAAYPPLTTRELTVPSQGLCGGDSLFGGGGGGGGYGGMGG